MYNDLYLDSFTLPDSDDEWQFFMQPRKTCYDSYYPFQIIAREQKTTLSFDNITILYGNNGSGKSTVLNVMAEKLGLDRFSPYNRTSFYGDYTALCSFEKGIRTPRERRIIVSDDVFDEMFRKRGRNVEIDAERQSLSEEYDELRRTGAKGFRLQSVRDAEKLGKMNDARRRTKSDFIKRQLAKNERTMSNGESALEFFSKNIGEDGLYLLDEPENSLSPNTQLLLKKFLEEQVRFYGCQLIIATHSPFLLSLKGAKIYDLDNDVVETAKWTDLPNVREYYEFFKEHGGEFE